MNFIEQVGFATKRRKLIDKAMSIGDEYSGLGLSVLANRDGMVLKINDSGKRVDFDQIRFDRLEEKWPGLSTRLEEVLDEELDLLRSRPVIQSRQSVSQPKVETERLSDLAF